jgi:hypothetical protein
VQEIWWAKMDGADWELKKFWWVVGSVHLEDVEGYGKIVQIVVF